MGGAREEDAERSARPRQRDVGDVKWEARRDRRPRHIPSWRRRDDGLSHLKEETKMKRTSMLAVLTAAVWATLGGGVAFGESPLEERVKALEAKAAASES